MSRSKSWQFVNRQIAEFGERLRDELALGANECDKVASLVAADVRFLPTPAKDEIVAASPVPLEARHQELITFQRWTELASSIRGNLVVTRAHVVAQNYICFVYLKDACFEVLAARTPPGSVAQRCSDYLSRGRVRDFRNAFSHGNWCYKSDFAGLECWVLADPRRKDARMRSFTVSQDDLNFWQCLARTVAYVAYEELLG